MASPELPVTPQVLRWAREVAGYSPDEVAIKLEQVSKRITPATIANWEAGESLPRLTALRKLAQLYKRPMAVFFLRQPPDEPPPPKNYRLLATGDERPLTPETLLAVRTARRLLSLARDVADELGYPLRCELPHATVDDDPVVLAAEERVRLGVSLESQLGFSDAYKALWYWRDILEDAGSFVFQLPFPVADARAFSEFHEDASMIVLSTKDDPVARVFSLFHEYAHLLLRASGICPDFRVEYLGSHEGRVEQFCNAFAGSFLVPATEFEAAAAELPQPTHERSLVSLSYQFSVSKQVILRRFLDLGWVERDFFARTTRRWNEERRTRPKQPGHPVKQEIKAISRRGRRFSSLIIEAADRGLIAPPTLYEGLGIRTSYLAEVRAQLMT